MPSMQGFSINCFTRAEATDRLDSTELLAKLPKSLVRVKFTLHIDSLDNLLILCVKVNKEAVEEILILSKELDPRDYSHLAEHLCRLITEVSLAHWSASLTCMCVARPPTPH